MTKKEQERRRKARKKAAHQERDKKTNQKPSGRKILARILSSAIVCLGAFSAIVNFLPKLSIYPASSLNPHDAFGTIFSLKNDGVASLHDISFSYCPGTVYEPSDNATVSGGKIVIGNWRVGELSAGDSVGLPFENTFSGFPNAKIDMVLVIHFRPDWWPWTRQKRFRFQSERATDGTWQWKEAPVGERCGDNPPYY